MQLFADDMWLHYYQSKLCLLRGDAEAAIKYLLPVLRRQSKTDWVWVALAQALQSIHPQEVIVCYARAIQLAQKEQNVARARIHLAQLLFEDGRLEEAARQVKIAHQWRTENNYKIPPELAQLLATDWYTQIVQNESDLALDDVSAQADALQAMLEQQNLQYQLGVVAHINHDKKLSFVNLSADKGVSLYHDTFPDAASLAPGEVIEVGFICGDNKPVKWRPSAKNEIPGLCQIFEGSLTQPPGRDFGFLQCAQTRIFVPPPLLQEADTQTEQEKPVAYLAVYSTSPKGKKDWRAIRRLS